ncbi:MAG: hypothetical protein ACREMY_13185, partial [bacterium]
MRTLKSTVCLLFLFLLTAATPAQAWWGWLEELSGPGKFRGPQFEFRLVCFGEESEAKRLVDAFKSARALTRKIDGGTTETLIAADDAWRRLTAQLNDTLITLPILDQGAVTKATKRIQDSWNSFSTNVPAPVAEPRRRAEDDRGSGAPESSRVRNVESSFIHVDPVAMARLINETEDAVQPLIAS